MALERFIPLSPDRFIRNSQDFEVARFGHLNEIINYINSYVLPDGLQLVGDGPMTTVLRAITDNQGNASRLSLSTDTTALSADLKFLGSTSGYVSLQAPNTVTTYALKLPATTGAAGEALVTDGFGNLSFSTVSSGLQLLNDVDLTSTLTAVTDKNNNQSPLFLSTTGVQTTSTLQITTQDDPYIDAEDGLGNNRFTIGRAPASQQVNVDFASNPTGGTNFVGGIRTYQDGVNLSEVVKFRKDGQVTFSERVNLEADSLVTTQASSVIAATTTNASLVLAPNGTGALIADIPDGTATGGNARGNNAVDLQILRGASTQIASGNNSGILSGYNNTANGFNSAVFGGNGNTASGSGAMTAGQDNNASGTLVTVFGRANTASSDQSTVSGGQSNTASTGTHATVVGGQGNVSSGQYSVSGGFTNTSSGESAVALGRSNISSGGRSVSIGFNNNNSTGYGIVLGNDNTVSQPGGFFYAGVIGQGNNVSGGQQNYVLGNSNTINATSGFNVAIGYQNSISGAASGAMAILGSSAEGVRSFAKGSTARAFYFNGETKGGSYAPGGNTGTVQTTQLIASNRQTVISGGTFQLYLDGASATQLIIPSSSSGFGSRSWNVQVQWVAAVAGIIGTATGVTVGDTKTSTDLLAVRRLTEIGRAHV